MSQLPFVKPDWALDDFFPAARGTWSSWRPPVGRKNNTESSVRSSLYRWHPWDPLLVSTPDSKRMLPPVCIPGLAAEVQSRMLLQYRIFIVVAALFSIFSFFSWVNTGSSLFFNAGVSVFAILMFVLTQYFLIFNNIDRLCATSRFVAWVFMRGGWGASCVAVAMLAIGVFQYMLQKRLGGLDSLLMSWGLVFDLADRQPWRYFLGPFIHSGMAHWAGNVAVLVFAAGLCAALTRRFIWVSAFVFGVVGSSLALSFFPYSMRLDAFVGISGGNFSLLGLLGCLGLLRKWLLPPFFALNIFFFSFLMFCISHFMNDRSNDVVHLLGWGIGFSFGFVVVGFSDSNGGADSA